MGRVWLWLVGLLVGVVVVRSDSSDIVHSSDGTLKQTIDQPTGYNEVDYIDDGYGHETTAANLNCYDCTSYMPSCKRQVTDLRGEIVSRSGCKSKCFLRVGEEKTGALYRGCMDDFRSAQLDQSYIGCKVQKWNGRKSLWCLCDNDLCNGENLKRLFYYGYSRKGLKGARQAAGERYYENEPLPKVDREFDEMTAADDNYNPLYVNDPKPVESQPEEIYEVTTPIYRPPVVSEPKEAQASEEVEDSQPADIPHQENKIEQSSPQEQPNYIDLNEQHLPDTEDKQEHAVYGPYPGMYREPYGQQFIHNGPYEYRYPPVPYPDDPADRYQLPQPSFYPAYPHPAVEPHLTEEGQTDPEAKSAYYPPYYPHKSDYQYYHYKNPADLELEPISYVPYEETQTPPSVNDAEPMSTPQPEPQPTISNELYQGPATIDVTEEEYDPNLYCPTAGIFTYEEDCSKFVLCLMDPLHGRPRMYLMKCPGGLVFDSRANTCMQPNMSDGCKRLAFKDAVGHDEVLPSDDSYSQQNPEGADKYEYSHSNKIYQSIN